MKKANRLILLLFVSIILLTACNKLLNSPGEDSIDHNLVMATLYNYYAAEYQALAYQAYNIGKKQLLIKRLHNPEAKNLAVVVDVDETILDNSPFEAKLILDNKSYNKNNWQEWCKLESAKAVPGALEFLQFADSLNFHIFYLSNRKKEIEQELTMNNLRKLGFPQINNKQFLFKTDISNKESRRQKILKKYKVVLFAGDNLGDFYEDSSDFTDRKTLMMMNKDKFGEKFLVLPNAMYGNWLNSLGMQDNKKAIDSLLNIMVQPYQK